MTKPISSTIYNEDGSVRWKLKISRNDDKFEVSEDTKRSLFSNPLSTGDTPGQALDNFLQYEAELIGSL